MSGALPLLAALAAFLLVGLASRQIGRMFVQLNLPLISGCLLTGIVAGPHVLGLLSTEVVDRLRFVDELAIAFIAFAAGAELYLKELRNRLTSIKWVTIGLVTCTFTLGATTFFLIADWVPLVRDFGAAGRAAVALMVGSILVARSPSSAIAIVKELRARGPFTRTALGVTVVMDVVVIVLFSITSTAAAFLLAESEVSAVGTVLILFAEIGASFGLGLLLGKLLEAVVKLDIAGRWKRLTVLAVGYGVFLVSHELRHLTHTEFGVDITVEPLLACMLGSFLAANRSRDRMEFLKLVHDTGPPVFVAFFTLAGASLALDVLPALWQVAVALIVVRLIGISIGSFTGGVIAGDPMAHNRIAWAAYVTQAGIGLGLAKHLAVEFPGWGLPVATLLTAVIIVNQLIGPPLFKWAIRRTGEAHPRAGLSEMEESRHALVFGLEGESMTLARVLETHGWKVRIASRMAKEMEEAQESDVDIFPIADLSAETLRRLDVIKADAIVIMLSDAESLEIAEQIAASYKDKHVVVRLNDRASLPRFAELGVLIVDSATAMVSLLDHSVRSPSTTSMLLGMDDGQDVVELLVKNQNLHGIRLRDLRLPLDTLVLSVRRRGHPMVSHGYTRLRMGDRLTVVGSPASLDDIAVRLEA